MKKQEQKKKCIGGKILIAAAGTALTAAGFMFIPPLIQKYGNKAYKASLKNEEIDFDNMGPEIVPHEEENKEEE